MFTVWSVWELQQITSDLHDSRTLTLSIHKKDIGITLAIEKQYSCWKEEKYNGDGSVGEILGKVKSQLSNICLPTLAQLHWIQYHFQKIRKNHTHYTLFLQTLYEVLKN